MGEGEGEDEEEGKGGGERKRRVGKERWRRRRRKRGVEREMSSVKTKRLDSRHKQTNALSFSLYLSHRAVVCLSHHTSWPSPFHLLWSQADTHSPTERLLCHRERWEKERKGREG